MKYHFKEPTVIIAIDWNNTVQNMVGHLCYLSQYKLTPQDFAHWDIPLGYKIGMEEKRFIDWAWKNAGVQIMAPPYDGARETINYWHGRGDTILIVTSSFLPEWAIGQWFVRHNIHYDKIIKAQDKSRVNFDLIIDDNPLVIQEMLEKELPVLKRELPWNDNIQCAGFSDWRELIRSKTMSENSLILADDKDKLIDLGHQVKALLPGGQKLTDNQAVSVANYAALTKANPFRGEIYGYRDKNGQLVLVDGYKLLIRWAKSISDYDEDYGDRLPVGVEGIIEGDIGYRITIMRHDRKKGIKQYIDLGAPFKEAFDLVANKAVGIVKANETRNAPPKGWSWDEVARKRALKNVLNRAYPMPSIEELSKLHWEVEGIETQPEDWAGTDVYSTTEESERHAELAANERHRKEKVDRMTEEDIEAQKQAVETATDLMRDNGDDDPLGLAEEDSPGTTGDHSAFWEYTYGLALAKDAAVKFITQANGDFDKALELLKADQE
jgi:hypothetical protein